MRKRRGEGLTCQASPTREAVRAGGRAVNAFAEVIIEQGNRPVAVLRASQGSGRKMSDVIAALEASGAGAVIDADSARDVEDGIKSHREPWHPPSWD